MINTPVNVSAYDREPPDAETDERQKIPGGPLYNVEQVRKLAARHQLYLWTRRAERDAQNAELDAADIAELVYLALQHGRYLNSEWCKQKPDGPWAACDAYSVVRNEWIEVAGKTFANEWYIKFAIASTGSVLLSVSNHL